jgi:diacylglycerol kinase
MFKRHTISFKHALDGLKWAVSTQPNFVIHLVIASMAILAGLGLHISTLEWLVIFLCITLGLVIELINTSIEAATDLITQEYRQFAKIAKDTSAAAMLVFAVGATVLASVIFLPKL